MSKKNNALNNILEVRDYLNASLIERNVEIDAMLAALISKNHVFLLGEPGVAKSMMIDKLGQCFVDANYFEILMTKFTKASELFGPQSIKSLREEDMLRYNTEGFLPEAHFASLDEIWKANSAALNSLLRLLQEGDFYNGNEKMKSPLRMVMGASNETPADSSLRALYDRFCVRLEVSPIVNDGAFSVLLDGSFDDNLEAPELTLETIDEAVAQAQAVKMSPQFLEAVLEIRQTLRFDEDNFADVTVSDRRWGKIGNYMRAVAYLQGSDELTEDHLLELRHTLWSEPDQIHRIDDLLNDYISETLRHARTAEREMVLMRQEIKIWHTQDETEANINDRRGLLERIKQLSRKLKKGKNKSPYVDRVADELSELNKEAVRAVYGDVDLEV